MKTRTELCEMLKYYVVENNISTKDLCEQLHVSQQSIYNWIHGIVKMSDRNYLKLMKLLDGYDISKWIINKDENQLEEHMYNV